MPVAIIYGHATGSAGEVVAISFRGKINSRSFGTETAGATTRIDNLELSDGACLNLACGWDADRAGNVYKGPVVPETLTRDRQDAIAAAKEWILKYKN